MNHYDKHNIGGVEDSTYFKLQAELGMTKHLGGANVTNELLKLCHVQAGQHVLDVGCGVGLSTLYMAKQTQAHFTGVDLRKDMVARAQAYAKEAGLQGQATFQVANAQRLPFENGAFDAVISQSVLTFVPDRVRALREFVRVTKPGGYIGFTEAIWLKEPQPEMKTFLEEYAGPESNLMQSESWETLLVGCGLQNTTTRVYGASPLQDARSQMQSIGYQRVFQMWGRAFYAIATNPEYRDFMKQLTRLPKRLVDDMGYGVYVGENCPIDC